MYTCGMQYIFVLDSPSQNTDVKSNVHGMRPHKELAVAPAMKPL